MRQLRTRPAATTGAHATARPSKRARSTAIHKKTAPQPTTGDHRRPRNRRARSTAIHNKTAPQPTSGDQRRPPATTGAHATARPSKRARSTAIHNKTAPQPTSGDQRRPPAPTQPPDPLRERDLLQFTIRQRRSRPPATTGAHATARPCKRARSAAIHNTTAGAVSVMKGV